MSPPTLKAAGTSSRTKTLALAAIGLAVLAAAGYGWWAWTTKQTTVVDKDASETVAQPNNGGVQLSAAQLRAQGVETALVKDAAVIPLDGLPAQTVAPLSASAQVVAPYGGVVTRVMVDEGAAVRQGQALARIQSKDVLAAQADLARARTDAAAAVAQARRDAALLAEGIIPAARNEQTQARAAAAQSTLQEANGALARLRPVSGGPAGEYELLAPLSGRVMRRHLILGQAVAPLDIAFVVAEPGPLDVSVAVPLRLRSDLHLGLEVRLPDSTTARVTAIGGDTDLSSQSLRVRARVDADQAGAGSYAAGQQISVALLLPAPQGTLSVPSSALLPAGSGHVVYVAEPASQDKPGDLRVRAVPVQLLGQDESEASSAVRSASPDTAPLVAGMQVVVRGTALLKSMIPLQ
ncbi:efflux RND transporter periplasmic adaptor subunit [Comamonas sp. Y6]|uniref:Efflux RND transporter periplasmic adaptor subunit n=1 Tax=Comamonas resistens TaxID=3046670 RepID=A0ABY8SPB7_9BURK|nr:efflux RND transporter periplasmic adaptor subunit [Comamonas resistens]MDL5038423.1 efflux RND transporter periplasmic adaptor subunit [Comamonas resistens]WHS64575.1 efflux RND transporter periplasmic adaptor subunit [Comamonas resistens]